MSNNSNPQLPDLKYKTELCRKFVEQNFCPYMAKCRFAHGKQDLQDKLIIGKNYKQKDCNSFYTNGVCPYGHRCLFRHDERKFSDLNRPFYKYILERNYTNLYLRNLNKSRKLSEDDFINESASDKFLNLKESNNKSNYNLGVRLKKNHIVTNSIDNGNLSINSFEMQKRKNSESEDTEDYSLSNYKSKKTKLYRPRLGVFERLRPQADSISFESTDVDIDYNSSHGALNGNVNAIGNSNIEKQSKSNFHNNANLGFLGKNKNETKNNFNSNLNPYSNRGIEEGYNFSNFDKNVSIANARINNNIGLNSQNNFHIVNFNSNNLINNTSVNNKYNNNLINSFSANLKYNGHLINGNIQNVNCNNNYNKNKLALASSNLFNQNNINNPNKAYNLMFNQINQSMNNKIIQNNLNSKNNFNNNGKNNVNSKTNYSNEDSNIYKANIKPNLSKKSDIKNFNTLTANHKPFYPSIKNDYDDKNNLNCMKIKKFENTEDQNNFNNKMLSFKYSDNYHKIFSNSNLNYDFFGEISSENAEIFSNTSILSTDSSHLEDDSIPNYYFNELENLNNFSKIPNKLKTSQRNLNKAFENQQSDFFCFEKSKKELFAN